MENKREMARDETSVQPKPRPRKKKKRRETTKFFRRPKGAGCDTGDEETGEEEEK